MSATSCSSLFGSTFPQASPEQFCIPEEIKSFVDPKVEHVELPNEHVYRLRLPRLEKKDVAVDIEKKRRVLRIHGLKKIEKPLRETYGENRSITLCKSGEFHRCFKLPENVKASETAAYLEDGELTVVVPKDGKTTSLEGKNKWFPIPIAEE